MAFMDSIKELVWPEGAGWGLAILAHWAARGIDSKKGWTKAFRRSQDWVAVGLAGGSGYAHSKSVGDTREIARGTFGANATLALEGAADAVYPPEKAFGVKTTRVKGTTPRRGLPQGAGAGTRAGDTGQMVSAEI